MSISVKICGLKTPEAVDAVAQNPGHWCRGGVDGTLNFHKGFSCAANPDRSRIQSLKIRIAASLCRSCG